MTPSQASKLLDRVLDEQLLDMVDLEAIIILQRQLYTSLCDCDVAEKEADARSRTMIHDALRRLANDFVEDSECQDANIVATPD